jgi:hypothetical protein
MKQILRAISLALVLSLVTAGTAGVVVTSVGCASTATPARKQFTAISDAAAAVTTAMQVFNSQYQAGKATELQRTQVLKTYAIYQQSALAAVDAERNGRPVDALLMVNNAALPLLDLLASFGGKP